MAANGGVSGGCHAMCCHVTCCSYFQLNGGCHWHQGDVLQYFKYLVDASNVLPHGSSHACDVLQYLVGALRCAARLQEVNIGRQIF